MTSITVRTRASGTYIIQNQLWFHLASWLCLSVSAALSVGLSDTDCCGCLASPAAWVSALQSCTTRIVYVQEHAPGGATGICSTSTCSLTVDNSVDKTCTHTLVCECVNNSYSKKREEGELVIWPSTLTYIKLTVFFSFLYIESTKVGCRMRLLPCTPTYDGIDVRLTWPIQNLHQLWGRCTTVLKQLLPTSKTTKAKPQV
jgi:hypothetical protein